MLSLTDLRIEDTNLSDAGLKSLADLRDLRVLAIKNSLRTGDLATSQPTTVVARITDMGLQHLARIPGLMALDLSGTSVQAKVFQDFASLSELRCLILDNTNVNDLSALAKANKLDVLHLNGTSITDRAILAVVVLDNLKVLELRRTSVTAKTAAVLRKSLPMCRIVIEAEE